MSYYAYYMDSDILIRRENMPFIVDALRTGYGDSLDNAMKFHSSISDLDLFINWFSDMYGYIFRTDDSGNITDIETEDSIHITDEIETFNKIAPFVEPGSYITMCGVDDDYWWRWYFDGRNCTEYEGVVTFPKMPPCRRELATNENIYNGGDNGDDIDDVCPENLRKILYKHE